MSDPLTRYRVIGYVTGVVLVLLVCVAMPLKYFADNPHMVEVVGPMHGWLYLFYVIATLNLAVVQRWKFGRTVWVALAGTIPFAVFFVERRLVPDEAPATPQS